MARSAVAERPLPESPDELDGPVTDDFDPDNPMGALGPDTDDDDDSEVLDLSDTPENAAFAILPPGVYEATVDEVEYGRSANSGNKMLTWQFETIIPDSEKTRRFYFHTVLTKEQLPRLKKTLVRIAPHLDLTQFNPKKACDDAVLVGLPCRLRIGTQKYQGETRNNVRDVLPPLTVTQDFLPS